MKVIIINGSARSGKDKFVKFFADNYEHKCFNWSTIDDVKRISKKHFGWNGRKNNKSRLFLSEMKRIWAEFNDGPFRNMVNKISDHYNKSGDENNIYFIHVREPEEIKKFVEEYKENCITILLKRDDRKVPNNNSDKNVNNFDYDYIINNNGVEKDLEIESLNFLEKITKII